jgi:hypothetical protein
MSIEANKQEPVGWIYEDELPKNYPYDAMFPFSKVEGVRMFPVFAPKYWVGLSVDESAEIAMKGLESAKVELRIAMCVAINDAENKLRQKNQ